MDVRKKFFETWKDKFGIVSTSVCSLILLVLEKVMEVEFQCPQGKIWSVIYSLSYFCIPAVVLVLLTAVFLPVVSPEHDSCCSCPCLIKASVPSLIWVTLLLLDGRYLSCPCEVFQKENITAAGKDQPTECYIISQITGLGCILFSAIVVCIYTKCRSHSAKEGGKNKTQDDIETEAPLNREQKRGQAVSMDVRDPHVSECVG